MEIGSDLGHGNAGRGAPPAAANAWMLNAEAVRNWAGEGPKKSLDAASELARLYYGQPPRRKYYMGSSGGGREAFYAVEKYPDDYDGIFAQVPAISQVSISLRATIFAQQQTTMERWLPPTKVPVIAKEVLRQCDGLDGLSDGVISNYKRCDAIFINHPATAHPWAQIRCMSGRDEGESCLSDGQIATLDFIHTDINYGYPLAYGVKTIAAFSVGGERGNWMLERMMPAVPYTGGLFPPLWKTLITGDQNLEQLMWDPAKYKDRWIAASKEYEGENPDLSRFINHGGKLIIKSNTADTAVNWREAAAYYERVVATVGRDRANAGVRYYVAPGQVHSMANNPVQRSLTGEEVPSQFDSVELLDAWVEGRATPGDAVMLYQKDPLPPFAVTSSRPICQYPLFPKFVGNDKTDGRSYRCASE
jgi:feruloyl esterase